MLDKETEKLIRLSKGSAFRAFGFGVNSLDFARAQLNLQENDPVNYRLFTDIADRILFVDHLRFELWQALESSDGGFGDSLRLITNLDSLETYLLCTCIDALAGGRDFVTFADWVQENQEKVAEQLGGKAVTSTNEFSSITANLHDSYTSEEVGLTRKFTAFFQELPEFLKQALAQNIVLIKGDYWSHNAKQKMQKWQNLSVDDQVKKIAGEYLYSVRRSKYTHAVKKHEAAGGFWKHLSQTPFEPNGWTPIRLKSSKNPDKVKLTILTSNTIEESYLLRAIISYHVLTNLLGYSVSDNYLEQFHKYYEALMEIHNFLREMQKSMEYLDFLLTPQANLDAAETYKDDPVRTFPESPAEKLLNKYIDFVSSLETDFHHYHSCLQKLNSMIIDFYQENESRLANSGEKDSALSEFSQMIQSSPTTNSLRWYHTWIYKNLKRHVRTGQILLSFGGIVPNQFSDSP